MNLHTQHTNEHQHEKKPERVYTLRMNFNPWEYIIVAFQELYCNIQMDMRRTAVF